MVYPVFDDATDPRIVRVRKKNDFIYFYSIKHSRLMKLTAYDVNQGRLKNAKCELCVAKYSKPKNSKQTNTQECDFRYTNFYKAKRHFYSAERKYCRQLIWSQSKFHLLFFFYQFLSIFRQKFWRKNSSFD